jgi:hypothetical protein
MNTLLIGKLLLPSIVLLAGCTCNPPIIKTVDKIVQVPVMVRCGIVLPIRPTMPLDSTDVSEPLDTKLSKALAEIERRRAYEGELVAAIEGCQ